MSVAREDVRAALAMEGYLATEPLALQTLCRTARDYLALLDERDRWKKALHSMTNLREKQ